MNVAFVSGGTRGIGLAIVQEFLSQGFTVVYTGTSEESVNKASAQLNNPKALGFVCNLVSANEVQNLFKSQQDILQHLNVLVNNAGVFAMDTFEHGEEELLQQLLDVNVLGTYRISKAAFTHLKSNKRAHVFNISSIAGLQAYSNGFSYGISKFALRGLSQSMRMEFIPHGIRVTTVYPGATLTDSWAGVDLPPSRFSKASDIAKSIFNAYSINEHSNTDEIIIRPVLGDI